MKAASAAKGRTGTLNLRIGAIERQLIDRAAASSGKTRTSFILEAARRAAEETLLEQSFLAVSPQAYNRFKSLLDTKPKANAALKRTLRAPVPWDKD